MAKTKSKNAPKGGFAPKTYKGGLSEKRMEKKSSGNYGVKAILKAGEILPAQFLGVPNDEDYFVEFEQHVWQDADGWNFVPCAGDDCPLCASDNERIAKTSYGFVAKIYNLKEKKVQVLAGPKDLAQRIFYRYRQKKDKFLKRTFELTKFPTKPVSYDVAGGDDDPVSSKTIAKSGEQPDLLKYLGAEMERYYGNLDGKKSKKSALDDDDDKKSKKSKKGGKAKSKGKKSKK